jgi:hypothetical protein
MPAESSAHRNRNTARVTQTVATSSAQQRVHNNATISTTIWGTALSGEVIELTLERVFACTQSSCRISSQRMASGDIRKEGAKRERHRFVGRLHFRSSLTTNRVSGDKVRTTYHSLTHRSRCLHLRGRSSRFAIKSFGAKNSANTPHKALEITTDRLRPVLKTRSTGIIFRSASTHMRAL